MNLGKDKLIPFFICLGVLGLTSCMSKDNVNTSPNDDMNGDGVKDVFVEYEDGFVFELFDRNFDSKIDESTKYSQNFSETISTKLDNNFDGILETFIVYNKGVMSKVCVDSNNNQLHDIVFEYKYGVLESAKRYYTTAERADSPQVGYLGFSFGYPADNEKLEDTNISEKEFSMKNDCK